jgi:hypothetical protein
VAEPRHRLRGVVRGRRPRRVLERRSVRAGLACGPPARACRPARRPKIRHREPWPCFAQLPAGAPARPRASPRALPFHLPLFPPPQNNPAPKTRRFDYVKGYAPQFVGEYIAAAVGPGHLHVGELWCARPGRGGGAARGAACPRRAAGCLWGLSYRARRPAGEALSSHGGLLLPDGGAGRQAGGHGAHPATSHAFMPLPCPPEKTHKCSVPPPQGPTCTGKATSLRPARHGQRGRATTGGHAWRGLDSRSAPRGRRALRRCGGRVAHRPQTPAPPVLQDGARQALCDWIDGTGGT